MLIVAIVVVIIELVLVVEVVTMTKMISSVVWIVTENFNSNRSGPMIEFSSQALVFMFPLVGEMVKYHFADKVRSRSQILQAITHVP